MRNRRIDIPGKEAEGMYVGHWTSVAVMRKTILVFFYLGLFLQLFQRGVIFTIILWIEYFMDPVS